MRTRTVIGERRTAYRIQYPVAERPKLTIGNEHYDVVELSESGLRFVAREACSVAIGDQFSGTLGFRDDARVTIQGRLLRLERGELVASLSVGPGFKRIVAEQGYLLAKYPELLRSRQRSRKQP